MGCASSTSHGSASNAIGPAPATVIVAGEAHRTGFSERKLTMRYTSNLSSETAQKLQAMMLDMARTGKLELTSTVASEASGLPMGTLTRVGVPSLKQIPGVVLTMTNLTELNLRCNQIYEVPSDIAALKALTVLVLAENQLIDLPPELAKLSNLRVLEIDENYIGSLPNEIGQLDKLEVLRANRNRLTALPDSLSGCVRLKVLNLYNNSLAELGTGISALCELEELTLSNNVLVTLPDASRWKNLKQLYLQVNQLTALPDMSGLCNLELLQAQQNQLTAFPAMDNLVSLRKIDVNTNQIAEIPRSFEHMAQLEYLNMRRNLLTSIPHLLCRCKALEILDLGGNPIASPVPADLVKLPHLKTLLLDGGQVTTLPIEIMGLRHVCRVNLGNCLKMNDQETFEVVMELRNTCTKNGGWLRTG